MDDRAALIENIVAELRDLRPPHQRGVDDALFGQTFDRWKARSVSLIRERVSLVEAGRFAALSTRTSWMTKHEGVEPLVREHLAFLVALHTDLEQKPESIPAPTSQNLKSAIRAIASGAMGQHLPMPERVTLKWMYRNVSYGTWVVLVGGLVVSFGLGFKLGQYPVTARIISIVLGGNAGANPASP